jgi:hypothetical protein
MRFSSGVKSDTECAEQGSGALRQLVLAGDQLEGGRTKITPAARIESAEIAAALRKGTELPLHYLRQAITNRSAASHTVLGRGVVPEGARISRQPPAR